MRLAAKEETVFPLAADLRLAENSHPGFQLPTAILHPGFGFAISNTATSLADPLYDFRGGPLCSGYFRDAETTLDYADQRFHQPGMGRFMSPDPYQASAGPKDPGSWNRYAYTRGDPVNRTDHSGMDDDECGAFGASDCGDGFTNSDPMNTGVEAPPGMINVQCTAIYGMNYTSNASACTISPEQYEELVDGPVADCTMTLYTRPLAGAKGKFLGTAATHSYLVLTDPNTGTTVTIDGTHVGNQLQDEIVPQSKGYGAGNNPAARSNYDNGTQVIPCSKIGLMESNAANFKPVMYSAGTNSNSFLHWLLGTVGLGGVYQAPAGAVGWTTPIPGNP
jgi:RHS repeat-associated protein